MIALSEKAKAGGRILYLTFGALEGWLLLGGGLIGLLVTFHLAPSDPGPSGWPVEYGPWHASLSQLRPSLEMLVLALPGTLGVLGVLLESFPKRNAVIVTMGSAIVAIAVFAVVFVIRG